MTAAGNGGDADAVPEHAGTDVAGAATAALRQILEDAAAGRFPPADGVTQTMPTPDGPVHAVLAFTAHHVVAAHVDPGEIAAHLDPDDIAAPMGAPFLSWLGERLGTIPGTLDVVLAARAGASAPPFPDAIREIDAGSGHERIARALRYRSDVRAWATADGDGLLVLGRGLGGRWEASFEVSPEARGRGLGRTLAAVSMLAVPRGERVFMQVAPGNVASLRAVLGAGFRPIGAEVLFHRDGCPPG